MLVELKNKEDLRILKMCNNPVGNFEYFLCIEDESDCSNYVAIAFRNCQVIDVELKDIDDSDFFRNSFRRRNISNVSLNFLNGFSHDSDLMNFLNGFAVNALKNKKLIIFEVKNVLDMFDGALKNKADYSDIVTRVWSTSSICSNDWNISGFDAMTFEIFLKTMNVRIRDISIDKMDNSQLNNKIRKVISKIY